jgi:hypothetical protein
LVKEVDGMVYEKAIEYVDDTDLVYDGDNWVAHGGVVAKGPKKVISQDGVTGTQDHIIFTSPTEECTLAHARYFGKKIWEGNKF